NCPAGSEIRLDGGWVDLISPSAKRSISPKAKDFTIAFSASNRKLTYIFRGVSREMEGQPRFFMRKPH
ncbi:MAG: hypothetical protein IKX49_04925, partial [Clostridia bacterium]|nr:hypothetical protein [Clostridia bacterium]